MLRRMRGCLALFMIVIVFIVLLIIGHVILKPNDSEQLPSGVLECKGRFLPNFDTMCMSQNR